MVVLFSLLSVFSLLLSKRRYGSYFTPLGAFATVWGIALVGYYANPFGYIPPYAETSIVFIFSYLAFVVGSLLVPTVSSKRLNLQKTVTYAMPSTPFAEKKANSRYLFIHGKPSAPYVALLTCLGFIITCIYFVATIQYYGLGTVLAGNLVRQEYVTAGNIVILSGPWVNYTFWFGLPVIYSAALLNLALLAESGQRRWYTFLPIASSLLFDVATQGRGHTLNLAVFYGSALLLVRQYKGHGVSFIGFVVRRNLRYVIMILVALVLMWQVGVLRHPERQGRTVLVLDRYEVPATVVHNINYLIGPLASFNVVFDPYDRHELWWGRNSFYPLEYLLRRYLRLDLFSDLPISVTSYPYPVYNGYSPFQNTYSYLRYLWDDWGYLGLVLGPALLGFLSTSLYQSVKREYASFKFCVLLIFMNVIVLSPTILNFANHTIMWAIPLVWISFYLPGTRVEAVDKPFANTQVLPDSEHGCA